MPSVDSHRVEQLCLDTAYCQFANTLFPASIALKKVKLVAELVQIFLRTSKILSEELGESMDKCTIKKIQDGFYEDIIIELKIR